MWHVAGAVVAFAALAGTGIAYASIPGPDAVIHGCYNTTNGILRVVDSAKITCAKGEKQIQWSQTGAQGPAGPPGVDGTDGKDGTTGAVGATGPAGGLSDVYVTRDDVGPQLNNFAWTTVLSLPLPVGTYTLHAKLTVFNGDPAAELPETVDCALSTGDAAKYVELATNGVSIALQDAVALPFGGNVKLDCRSVNALAADASLMGVKVGAIR